MAYYRGTGHGENQGAIHICFSDDYGESWTDEDTDLDGNPVARFPMNPPDADPGEDANEPWLVRYDDDTLLLFFMRCNWGTNTFHGAYQSKSTDGGITWSAPTRIIMTGAQNNDYVIMSNDHFIFDGRLYCAYEDKATGERCCVGYTDDKGDTWTHLSVIASNASEASLEYIGGNKVVSVLRAGSDTHTYYTTSSDLAATWASTQEITYRIPPVGRPRIQTRAHLLDEADWWNDPNLILWGFYFDYSDGTRKRVNCVSLSKNGGASWTAPFVFDAPYSDAGYGDMFYNPLTGEYVFMCYRGTQFKAALVQYNLSIDWGT